jgi:hypothetical protein
MSDSPASLHPEILHKALHLIAQDAWQFTEYPALSAIPTDELQYMPMNRHVCHSTAYLTARRKVVAPRPPGPELCGK